eukprot:gene10066-18713_t
MAAKHVNKELLIESVRKYPCLYDTSRKDYKDDSIRENAWKIVCIDALNHVKEDQKLLNEDIAMLKRVFKNLRDRYMKMKKEYKPSGSAGGVPLEPSWPFFAQLQFLDPFLKHRPTTSNLQVTSYGFERFSEQETTLQTDNEDSFVNLPDEEIETLSSSLKQTSSPDTQSFTPILSATVSIE